MKITDYIQSLDLVLNIKFGNHTGPWIASISKFAGSVEFKNASDDAFLRSCAGYGKSTQEALADLCHQLKAHKYIVIPSIDHKNRMVLPLPDLEF